ncbi:D-type cyclin [Seminavis robusta]|uniref:D-type cyclin n=1 Tax=Seminavis robusta TaxID=568900 RepID=A0A9N8E2I8_9STRA|nr:D-type cyclin [Seminavis robusta]|eukprot:Sro552_g165100.1 D-type cyclin (291) ;mRNA; r:33798-34670
MAKVSKPSLDEVLNMDSRDLYLDMKQRQSEYVSPETYSPNASYLSFRRYLVDWMTSIGESFRLHDSTIHVSVLFLDKILRSRNEIPREQWQLIATACISLAAKYEEAEEHCPHIPDLLRVSKLSNAGHTSLTFREGETQVLNYLNWKLRAVPAIHVVGYFHSCGVLFDTDRWNNPAPASKVNASLEKFAVFFSNLTLQSYEFCKYYPTLLGAAILLASRVAVKVEPHWRPELTKLTGYKESDIEECFRHIWHSYSAQFPNHVTQYQYRSSSPRSVVFTPVTTTHADHHRM